MATLTAKYKPYPAYKPSSVEWVCEVPAHWEIKRLKYVAALNPSASEVRKLRTDTEVSFVPMESVGEYGGLDLSLTKEISDVGDGYTYFSDGDVVVAKITPCFENGKGSLAGELVNGIAFGTTELHVMRCRPELDQQFAFYLTLTNAFRKLGEAEMYGAGGQKRVPESFITNLKHPIPPSHEQRAIAAFLDRETARIDALVVKKERLIELLQEKRTALITRAVTKGLDPKTPMKDSGVEWLGEIPAHWEVRRLKEIGEALIGLTYSPNDVVGQDEGSLVLRASNISEGKIVFEDNVYVGCPVTAKLITREGDILICSRNGSRRLIGKNAIIDSASSGMTFGAFMTVYRSTHNEYLHYVFNSALFEFQSGMFMTSTINQLTLGMLNGFSVPVPPVKEQTAIAAYLDQETARLDLLVDKVQEAIEHLRELRSSLISAAVTGRIDVREEAGCK